MNDFADAEWDRAHRALDSARQLLESDPDSAASRAYYAAFHALTAVFARRGQSFTKNTAPRASLHPGLIQSGGSRRRAVGRVWLVSRSMTRS